MWYNVKKCRIGENGMAFMYFSKFNINSQIFDVYKEPALQGKILNLVFQRIDNTAEIEVEEDECRYKFCDIIKDYDNLTVVGRLVKIFDGEEQSYDAEKDTVATIWQQDKAESSTFCFDLKTEQIAFIIRRGLKYRQFNKYFKLLIEKHFPEDAFEVYLENNIGELKKKIGAMQRILSIESTIVPPNANEAEYDLLFGATREEIKASGATLYKQGLEITAKSKKSLMINNNLVNRMFYAISKGYGELVAKGRDGNNTPITVKSDEDAPYVAPIPEQEKDSLTAFRERALPVINQLVAEKKLRTMEAAGEIDVKGENKE